MQKNAIVAQQLYHSSHGNVLIRNVSIAVPEGEIYAVVGEDGCGKTSLLKILSGFEKPERGILALFGNPNPSLEEYRKVGVVPEQGGFYERMSGKANLKMKSLAFGNYTKERIQEAVRITGLEKMARRRAKSYNAEQKVRLGIAMAVIGSPKILLIDEKLDGISQEERAEIAKILKRLNKKYRLTIVIATREIQNVREIATWYGMMRKGVVTTQFPEEQRKKDPPETAAHSEQYDTKSGRKQGLQKREENEKGTRKRKEKKKGEKEK